jgi:hypothetical protein
MSALHSHPAAASPPAMQGRFKSNGLYLPTEVQGR